MTTSLSATRVIFNGPDHNPSLIVDEKPLPSISDGEILVKMLLATVCGSDMHTFHGTKKEATPSVLGHEAVVKVVESKRQDASVAVGDRITFSIADSCGECERCKYGLPQKCIKLFKFGHAHLSNGTGFNGCYASHIVLRKGTHVVKIPGHVTDKMAAPINCALATMVNVTSCITHKGPKNAALVQGAGLLGLYGCAILKEQGYSTVYCSDVNADRLRLVPLFGGVPVKSGVDELPSNSIDAAIEVCGVKSVIPTAIDLLKHGSTYMLVGLVHPDSKLNITAEQIIRKCLTVKGVHNYAPEHLDKAVEFISKTASKYPYERLVGGEVFKLHNLELAIEKSKTQLYHRIAVQP